MTVAQLITKLIETRALDAEILIHVPFEDQPFAEVALERIDPRPGGAHGYGSVVLLTSPITT